MLNEAIVEVGAKVHPKANVWHFCHIRSGAVINEGCSLGKDVYVDGGVEIGRFSRIQNGVSLYRGVNIGEYVFVGPHVNFTNDRYPRVLKKNWKVVETIVEDGCSIGAGVTVVCGVSLGAFSMVGAGAIVTKDILPFHLIQGSPAKTVKKICACGDRTWGLEEIQNTPFCDNCENNLPTEMLKKAKLIFAQIEL